MPSGRTSTPVKWLFSVVANPIWPTLPTTMKTVPALPIRGLSSSQTASPVMSCHLQMPLHAVAHMSPVTALIRAEARLVQFAAPVVTPFPQALPPNVSPGVQPFASGVERDLPVIPPGAQLRVLSGLLGRLAPDLDSAHDGHAVNDDLRAAWLALAARDVLEGAHDADASDLNRDVLWHGYLDAAHDGDRVDRHDGLGEPGLAQIDLTAAKDRHRGEFLGHHPVALAGETPENRERAVRRRLAADPGQVARLNRRGSRSAG